MTKPLAVLTLGLILASCQGDAGPVGPAGPAGPQGPGATITLLTYTTAAVDAAPSTTTTQLRTLGTFTKASATTRLDIVWSGTVTGVVAGPSDGYCTFQIRVNGTPSTAATVSGATFGGAVGALPYSSVATVDVFTGLAAGTHTLTLWDRGIRMTSCTDNPGNFTHWVVVTEY